MGRWVCLCFYLCLCVFVYVFVFVFVDVDVSVLVCKDLYFSCSLVVTFFMYVGRTTFIL